MDNCMSLQSEAVNKQLTEYAFRVLKSLSKGTAGFDRQV
jgi:hypothetical protein